MKTTILILTVLALIGAVLSQCGRPRAGCRDQDGECIPERRCTRRCNNMGIDCVHRRRLCRRKTRPDCGCCIELTPPPPRVRCPGTCQSGTSTCGGFINVTGNAACATGQICCVSDTTDCRRQGGFCETVNNCPPLGYHNFLGSGCRTIDPVETCCVPNTSPAATFNLKCTNRGGECTDACTVGSFPSIPQLCANPVDDCCYKTA